MALLKGFSFFQNQKQVAIASDPLEAARQFQVALGIGKYNESQGQPQR